VQEKERAKDLIAAAKQCETMAAELLALAAGADSAGRILTATDRRNVEFLDVLIENEQKEVIAHTVVQRYLQVCVMLLNDVASCPYFFEVGRKTQETGFCNILGL
jgi:hypothetical protein